MTSSDLHIDFLEDPRYRRKNIQQKSDPFRKAFPKTAGEVIWDLTAGLCVDAVHLLHLGFEVVCVEREVWLAEEIEKALKKAQAQDPKFQKMQIFGGESLELLPLKFERETSLYLDPMFEETGSALPKKNMQILRSRIDARGLDAELLEKALASNAKRVVIKRGLKSEPLRPGFFHQVKGKAIRFDIYKGLGASR